MKSRIVAAITAAAALTAAIAIIPVMAETETKTETEFAVAAEPVAKGNITIESKSIDTSDDTVSVNFENTYDGRLNAGSGIVNSFLYDSESDQWIPVQTKDSTP